MMTLYKYFPIKNRKIRRIFVLLDEKIRNIKARGKETVTLDVHSLKHRRK
jgi:hypothetical protein